MRVAQIWRYSVKSLRGERLERIDILADGLRGDRSTQVIDDKGARMTGRTAKRLLGLQAGFTGGGEPTIDGHSWESDEALGLVRDAAGPGASLAPLGRHFDDRPILITTDGAIDALGVDLRRLRPNIVIEGAEGLEEVGWVGRHLRLGGVELDVVDRCVRCVMTTIDPDSLEVDPGVLRRINDEFESRVGVLCEVATAGELRVGDEAELL
ncbi:MAG: MOSC domain-containing protein [Actinomycetota bacterium]|nr:MOSC domain-containing protein [Actinomycetota bacterium]